MSAAGGGDIFVSYRREGTSHIAGRLGDHLTNRFGDDQVFVDVEAIGPGVDFREAISLAVDACVVLVALIGPDWLAAADGRGGRRLDDPDDLVRLEIGAALARGVLVIPVLVEGAVMPRREDLPDPLAGLARRNALRIRHESFRDDTGRLIAAIERGLASATVADDAGAAPPAGAVSGVMVKESPEAGRNDPARAARLLDDAERIANTLNDDVAKSYALSGVARAVAVTDPDRAERITDAITNEYAKVQALSGVAQAVAATDSDRAIRLAGDAERIADSITTDEARVQALSRVAQGVAAADPDRAARLADDAERIANSITLKSTKVRALSDAARARAATDPRRAARLADEAERLGHPLTNKFGTRTNALSHVAGVVAATDPDRAERIADSLHTGSPKVRALTDVAQVVVATDPGRAARLADDAERIANSLLREDAKAYALSDVAGAVAVIDPDRAERIANAIATPYEKALALSGIAKTLVE